MSILNEKIYINDGVKGELLFDGDLTGTNSTQLTKNITKYKYAEVYGNGCYTKVSVSNSQASGQLNAHNADGNIYIRVGFFSINGTTLTISKNIEWWKPNANASGGYSSGNYIHITKVIGYK